MLYGARLHHHFTNNCFIYAVKLMNREKNIEEMEKQSNCLIAATLFRGIYQQINSYCRKYEYKEKFNNSYTNINIVRKYFSKITD